MYIPKNLQLAHSVAQWPYFPIPTFPKGIRLFRLQYFHVHFFLDIFYLFNSFGILMTETIVNQ